MESFAALRFTAEASAEAWGGVASAWDSERDFLRMCLLRSSSTAHGVGSNSPGVAREFQRLNSGGKFVRHIPRTGLTSGTDSTDPGAVRTDWQCIRGVAGPRHSGNIDDPACDHIRSRQAQIVRCCAAH